MKKLIAIALMLVTFNMFGADAFTIVNDGNYSSTNDASNTVWMYMSKQQWEELKKKVDAKGASKILNYNAGIVITNGLPNVEAVLPILNNLLDNDLERSKLHMPGRRGDNKKPIYLEPMPYIGQTI